MCIKAKEEVESVARREQRKGKPRQGDSSLLGPSIKASVTKLLADQTSQFVGISRSRSTSPNNSKRTHDIPFNTIPSDPERRCFRSISVQQKSSAPPSWFFCEYEKREFPKKIIHFYVFIYKKNFFNLHISKKLKVNQISSSISNVNKTNNSRRC